MVKLYRGFYLLEVSHLDTLDLTRLSQPVVAELANYQTSFAARSAAEPHFSTATLDTWHHRMGHIGTDALKQLGTHTQGAKLLSNTKL